MAYLRTDDHVRIYYEEHGPTEPKATGSPLVLAYGIGGNADLWDVNVPALAARHRLVLWEPRGHARSDSPEDPARYSFTRWALDLKAVLDHMRLRTAHVGGLSLARPLAARHQLVVGGGAAAVGGQHRHARALDRGHADPRHGRHGRVRDGVEPQRGGAPGAGPILQGRVLCLLPPAHADRLRQRAPRAARDGPHHRASVADPRTRAADRRRSRPVARSHEGDAGEGPWQPADRALAGQPLRQPGPAGGVEPRGARVPGALRRRRARTTPRAPALRSGEAERQVIRRRRWWCTSRTRRGC